MSRQLQKEMQQGLDDVRRLRKSLVWMAPFSLCLVYLCWRITEVGVISTVADIRQEAPIVNIYAIAIAAPGAIVFFSVALINGILRALCFDGLVCWINKKIAPKLTVFVGVSMVVILIGSWPVQRYIMPKLGYSRCGILYGHTSLFSAARWLKYPELCVRDKSIAWVKEQARLIEQQTAAPKQ